MQINVSKEVAALQRLTIKELRNRYLEVFNEPTSAANRDWLLKRIVWRMQSLAEGDLSERARQRAAELACDADLRMSPPRLKAVALDATERTLTATLPTTGDSRVPVPGTVITRKYKDGVVQVRVLASGFEYQGEMYKSLSAVAKAVTGSHCNGFAFFNLQKEAV